MKFAPNRDDYEASEGARNDYEFEVEEFDEHNLDGQDDVFLMNDTEVRSRLEKEILFQIQGVGAIKSIGGIDVYVKSEHCEESIRELIKHLKNESPKNPIIKHILGQWSFLQRDLLPLLIFHDKDKKLSFLTLMLLVQLTEFPADECDP
jgi:hypothetical protein